MDHDQFIGQVQDRARLPSRGAAERATRATLETLGERLTGGAAQDLAARLPIELGEHLRRSTSSMPSPMTTPGFLDLVTEREGVAGPDATFHARCVIEVVEEITSAGLLAHVREQLPDAYVLLFDAGGRGHMPPGP